MTKLKSDFSRKRWKDCCGKGCKKCEIAQAYIDRYGRAEGLAKLNVDRDSVRSDGKSGGKKGRKNGGKKGGKAKKKAKA